MSDSELPVGHLGHVRGGGGVYSTSFFFYTQVFKHSLEQTGIGLSTGTAQITF